MSREFTRSMAVLCRYRAFQPTDASAAEFFAMSFLCAGLAPLSFTLRFYQILGLMYTEMSLFSGLRFYRWGGPSNYHYSLGWIAGKDHDLVCVKRRTRSEWEAWCSLSPVCGTRLVAAFAFLLKAILVRVDLNLRDQKVKL